MRKIFKNKGKTPKLTPEQEDYFYNLPYNRVLDDIKQERKDKRLARTFYVFIAVMAASLARNLGVVERPNIYVNNQNAIKENLDIMNIDDELFITSKLNKEYLVCFRKNISVGVHEDLGPEQIAALTEAVDYVNYVLNGLNPDYKISLDQIDDLGYKGCDIVVGETNFMMRIKEKFAQITNPNFSIDTAIMIASQTNGMINTNAIYKSNIFVNGHHFADGKYSHDEIVGCYIHELCHCIFGFADVKTSKNTLMKHDVDLGDRCMYYMDLVSAAASICDLSNEQEKNRVYDFICKELLRQIDNNLGSNEYRSMISKKIAEFKAEPVFDLN